jgi:hypothetical protein
MPHQGIRIADHRHHNPALPHQYAGMTVAEIEEAQLAEALQMSLDELKSKEEKAANTAASLNAGNWGKNGIKLN